jgi:hypothetical protein
MATIKVKQTKRLYKITVGQKELNVLAALVYNTAANKHAYSLSAVFEPFVDMDNLPEVRVEENPMGLGSDSIYVEVQ